MPKMKTNNEIRLLAGSTLKNSQGTILLMYFIPTMIMGLFQSTFRVSSGPSFGGFLSIFFNMGFSVILQCCMIGLYYSILMTIRGEKEYLELSDLFYAFKNRTEKHMMIALAYTLIIYVGTLLFIIPGIIAAYGFSQVFYIVIDNPDMEGVDIFKESWRLMLGRKWKLFCLYFSYCAMLLLPGAAILLSILTKSALLIVIVSIVGIMMTVMIFFLIIPRMLIAATYFYEDLLANDTKPVGITETKEVTKEEMVIDRPETQDSENLNKDEALGDFPNSESFEE